MKLKILITSLTSCSGCISTLMSLDIFPQFLERTQIVYFPFILDESNITECHIALIEGCISTEEQVDLVKNIRKMAKKVYALGTCAAFGGILSLSKKKTARALDEIIEIDGIIPGCPPPMKLLGNCLMKMMENKKIELPEKTMCASCPLRDNTYENLSEQYINSLFPPNNEIQVLSERKKCFLKDGVLCLGPITRDGCDLECIQHGIPCEGCMGPVAKDSFSNTINFLSLLELSNDLKKYKGIFYRFSKPIVRR